MNRIIYSRGLILSHIIVSILQENCDLNEELEKHKQEVYIDALQNCREQGLSYWMCVNGKYFTWCTYEHRNSDEIILNGKEGLHNSVGDLPYKGDKYEYIASFSYDEYVKAADALAKEIINFIRENEKDEK